MIGCAPLFGSWVKSLETLFLGSHDLSGQASQVNPPRSLQPADLGSPPST